MQEISRPVTTDRDSLSGQVVNHSAATAAGILQVEIVDSGHDPPHRRGLVLQRGSGQAQERILAADAELGVAWIDQLALFGHQNS